MSMNKNLEFTSFIGWKEKYFPELSKEEKYEKLRKDSEQLATVLANDAFDSLRKRNKRKT